MTRKAYISALAMIASVAACCQQRASGAETTSAPTPATTSAPAPAVGAVAAEPPPTGGNWLFTRHETGNNTPPASPSRLAYRMLAYAALIGVLGVAAIVVTRKVLPRLGVATGASRSMAVRETAYLGAKNAVYLLQVGSRRLLIGRCRESLTTLADVTDAFDDPREPAEPEGPP